MTQTRQFLVNLIFDAEYNGYVADVPQLPGCMSQGKTVEAARKNVRQAIRTYLKVAQPPTHRSSQDLPRLRSKLS
jgi:predicted RNase H-like HicB family nuclease